MERMSKGFSTVLIAIMLVAIMFAFLSLVEVASIYAAKSISYNVCSIAGRSVLSEFDKELFLRYELFALKKSSSFIRERAAFYISNSLNHDDMVVKLRLRDIEIDYDEYTKDNYGLIEDQMKKVSGTLNAYISQFFSYQTKQKDETKNKNEIEYIICGLDSDDACLFAVKAEIYALRFAVNTASFTASPEKLEDYDEILYASYIAAPSIKTKLIVLSAAAAKKSAEELEALLDGEKIGDSKNIDYLDMLNSLMIIIPNDTKILRACNLIETNLSNERDFNFSEFIFGFDLKANFSRKRYFVFEDDTFKENEVFEIIKYN